MVIYLNRGSAYANNGDLDRAISDWNKVIQLSPKNALAYFNLGWAYSQKGEPDTASANLKKALELCGTDTQLCQYAQQLLQQLGVK
jgi:Flp pilus assembly protein TadD